MQKKAKSKRGFTLIEILVVIGLIAILATIVLIAINPARQFAQARNTQRTSDVNTILNAIGQYTADNKGTMPAAITTSDLDIEGTGGADLCPLLMPTYVSSFPVDPSVAGGAITTCNSTYDTKYHVVKDATTGRITVTAPTAEIGATISVSR